MRLYLAPYFAMAVSALCLGATTVSAQPVSAQEPSAAGLWQQVDDAGKISGWFIVTDHNGTFEGSIAKMFMKPGEPPDPHCDKCEGDQKGAPWLGLTIIKGMERKGLDYEKGSIMDPRNGNVWHAEMHLSQDGQDLTVRGYLGVSFLGMNQYWKRLPDTAVAQLDPTVAKLLPQPAQQAKPNPAAKARAQGGTAGGPPAH
jgi:uncharacterized protein (DUF2147 family)